MSFETKIQALMYMESPGVYNRGFYRRDLFHASVSEKTIHFWTEGLTWKISPEMLDYNLERETPSQLPWCAK